VRKKILVTGATGFIGSQLVIKLASTDDDISILVRKSSDLTPLESVRNSITVVYGDLADKGAIAVAMKGVDQLYHSAGLTYMATRRIPFCSELMLRVRAIFLKLLLRPG